MVGDNLNNVNSAGQPNGQPQAYPAAPNPAAQPVAQPANPPVAQPPVQPQTQPPVAQPLPQYPAQPQGQPAPVQPQAQNNNVYMNSPYGGKNPSNTTSKNPHNFYKKKKVSKRNWMIIGISVAIFVLFVAGIFIYLGISDDSKNSTPPTPDKVIPEKDIEGAIDLTSEGVETSADSVETFLTCEVAKTELVLKSACYTGSLVDFTFSRGSSEGVEDGLVEINQGTKKKRIYLTDHGDMLATGAEKKYINSTDFVLSSSATFKFAPILKSEKGFAQCAFSDPVNLTTCA